MTLEECVQHQNAFAAKVNPEYLKRIERNIQAIRAACEPSYMEQLRGTIAAMNTYADFLQKASSLPMSSTFALTDFQHKIAAITAKMYDCMPPQHIFDVTIPKRELHLLPINLQLFGDQQDEINEDDEPLMESITEALATSQPFLTPDLHTECVEVLKPHVAKKFSLNDVLSLIGLILGVIQLLYSLMPDDQLDKLIELETAQIEQQAIYAEQQHEDNMQLLHAIEVNSELLAQLNERAEELEAEQAVDISEVEETAAPDPVPASEN